MSSMLTEKDREKEKQRADLPKKIEIEGESEPSHRESQRTNRHRTLGLKSDKMYSHYQTLLVHVTM
jgi:hypothetical protein